MAEDSRITNVEGELGVASEVTMRRLLEEMKKMARASGRDPNTQEEKIRKNLRRSMLGEIEVRDDVTDSLKVFNKGLRIATSPLRLFSSAAIGAANVVGNVAGTVTGFGKELLVGGERLQDFSQHLPLVGKYLSGIAGQLDTATDSYRQLTAVGASFNNSILDMYKASIGAAMGFERFNELILENSTRMNFFAGTVSGGAREIGRLSKQMREGDTANALFNMGFTIEDISEALINYTQLEARTTGRRIRNENTLIQGTQAYLEEINKLAKITGLNRKEQEQIMLQNMQEANVAVMRSKLTGDARDNFDSSLKLMAANFPGYTAAFKDLMDGIPQTELGKQLASLIPGFSDLAQAAARGEVTQEEFDKRIRELTPRFKELRDQFGPAGITALMQNGFSELFDGMYNIFEYSSKAFDPEKAEAEAKKRDAVTGALTQFSNVVNQVRTGLLDAFIDSGFFENMETFVTKTFTSEKIDTFSNNIATFMNAFVKDPSGTINEMFQNIKTYLYDAIFGQIANVPGDGMTEVFRQGGLIESLSNGFRDLFKQDGVISALKEGVNSITGSIVKGFTDFWKDDESQKMRDVITDMFKFLTEEIILSIAEHTPFMGGAARRVRQSRVMKEVEEKYSGLSSEQIDAALGDLRSQMLDITTQQTKLTEFSPEWKELANETDRIIAVIDSLEIMQKQIKSLESISDLEIAIDNLSSNILKSISGENVYWGSETKGRERDQEQIKNLLEQIKNITDTNNRPDILEEIVRNLREKGIPGFSLGSSGFRNFGSGTLAMLHGREAVVREDSEMGQLLQLASNSGIPWSGSAARLMARGNQIPRTGPPAWMGGSPPPVIPGLEQVLTSVARGSLLNPWAIGAKLGLFADINPGMQDLPRGSEDNPFFMGRPTAPVLGLPTEPDSSSFGMETAMGASERGLLRSKILLGELKSAVTDLAPTTSPRPIVRPVKTLQDKLADSIDGLDSTISNFLTSSAFEEIQNVPAIIIPQIQKVLEGFGDGLNPRMPPEVLQAPVIDSIDSLASAILGETLASTMQRETLHNNIADSIDKERSARLRSIGQEALIYDYLTSSAFEEAQNVPAIIIPQIQKVLEGFGDGLNPRMPPEVLQAPVIDSIDSLASAIRELAPTTSPRPMARPNVPTMSIPQIQEVLEGFGDSRTPRMPPEALQAPVIDSIDSLGSAITSFQESSNRTGNTNTELQKKLNTTMDEMKVVLRELRDINKRIETNTRSLGTNVSSGYITSIR